MGCLKLHIDIEPTLSVAYQKKGQKVSKITGSYYPFGLKHKGYNNVTTSNGNAIAQKKLFNGKEFQDELGLNWHDYGARNYDATLGRWLNIDPLADHQKQLHASPFAYANNNPIRNIDPDGMLWVPNGQGGYIAEEGDTIWGLENELGVEHGSIEVSDRDNIQVGQVVDVGRSARGMRIYPDRAIVEESDLGGLEEDGRTVKRPSDFGRTLAWMAARLLEIRDPTPDPLEAATKVRKNIVVTKMNKSKENFRTTKRTKTTDKNKKSSKTQTEAKKNKKKVRNTDLIKQVKRKKAKPIKHRNKKDIE